MTWNWFAAFFFAVSRLGKDDSAGEVGSIFLLSTLQRSWRNTGVGCLLAWLFFLEGLGESVCFCLVLVFGR